VVGLTGCTLDDRILADRSRVGRDVLDALLPNCLLLRIARIGSHQGLHLRTQDVVCVTDADGPKEWESVVRHTAGVCLLSIDIVDQARYRHGYEMRRPRRADE